MQFWRFCRRAPGGGRADLGRRRDRPGADAQQRAPGQRPLGLGPTAVVLRLEPGSPWVYGALVNDLWSVGSGDDAAYNNFLLQPFVNYNLPDGVYVNSGPVITANWRADGGERWTVPFGAGSGEDIPPRPLAGEHPELGAYYNVAKPDHAADWQGPVPDAVHVPEVSRG